MEGEEAGIFCSQGPTFSKFWTNKQMDEYFVTSLKKMTLLKKKFSKSLRLNKTRLDNKDQPWTFSSVPFSVVCP